MSKVNEDIATLYHACTQSSISGLVATVTQSIRLAIARESKTFPNCFAQADVFTSTPIGSERVEFTANWVFDPNTSVRFANAAGLHLDELTVLDQQGGNETILSPSLDKLNALAKEHYRLGIFHFLKAA